MVTDTQRSITKAPAYADNLDIDIMVADIVSYLFQTPQGGEVTDGLSEDDFSFQSQAGGHPGHVLLGHPDIKELIRKSLGK